MHDAGGTIAGRPRTGNCLSRFFDIVFPPRYHLGIFRDQTIRAGDAELPEDAGSLALAGRESRA